MNTHCSNAINIASRLAHLLTIDKEACVILLERKIRNGSTDDNAALLSALINITAETICICNLHNCPLNCKKI